MASVIVVYPWCMTFLFWAFACTTAGVEDLRVWTFVWSVGAFTLTCLWIESLCLGANNLIRTDATACVLIINLVVLTEWRVRAFTPTCLWVESLGLSTIRNIRADATACIVIEYLIVLAEWRVGTFTLTFLLVVNLYGCARWFLWAFTLTCLGVEILIFGAI